MAPPSSALWEGRRPTLREARPDELDSVGQVMEAAYQEYMPPNPSREWLAYREEVRDVRRRLGVSTLIVAEIDGRLVGGDLLSGREQGDQRRMAAVMGSVPSPRGPPRRPRPWYRPPAHGRVHPARPRRPLRGRRSAHDASDDGGPGDVRADRLCTISRVGLLSGAPVQGDGLSVDAVDRSSTTRPRSSTPVASGHT